MDIVYIVLHDIESVDVVIVAGSPAPTLVKAVTVKMKLVPISWPSGVVNLVSRSVLLVTDSGEPVGQKDTSYCVMTPLGLSGSSQMMVILVREGTAVMITGPGAGERDMRYFNHDSMILLSSSVCSVMGSLYMPTSPSSFTAATLMK